MAIIISCYNRLAEADGAGLDLRTEQEEPCPRGGSATVKNI